MMRRLKPIDLGLMVIGVVLVVALILLLRSRLQPAAPVIEGLENLSVEQRLVVENPLNASVFAGWCENGISVIGIEGVDVFQIGTHPDLVDYFWQVGLENAAKGRDPRRVICGRPGLVNANTGVIYGLATGTSGFFLRLPDGNNEKAGDYGPGWSSVEAFSDAVPGQSRSAFDYAET
jgi:hypothetical protein